MTAPLATISLVLDVPPSVNNAFINVKRGGRVKSPEYRTWQAAAHWSVIAQSGGNRLVAPPYAVSISLPIKMRGDLDNRIKGVLDLLTRVCVITDDSEVVEITAKKNCATPGKCAVLVETVQR